MKAVFVGADPQVAQLAALSVLLRWPDAIPLAATTGSSGLDLIKKTEPDVVLLHPDFSDMPLAEMLKQLRNISSDVPLLVLAYQKDTIQVVTALELGADDYVRLPCDLTEIMARIWAMLRRVGARVEQQEPENGSHLDRGRLLISPASYEAFLDGRRLMLTSTEFRLLHLLVKNRGAVVSHQALEEEIWGAKLGSPGPVKKYIQRLRRKMQDDPREPRWIASIHGVGYRFIGPIPQGFPQSRPVSSESAA